MAEETSPGHPPEHHEGDPKGKGKKGKKVGGVSQKVLVAGTLLLVLLAYLQYRRMKASASSSTTAATTANGLGGQPAFSPDSSGGGGGGSGTGSTFTGGTSGGGGSTSPIAVVADQADAAIALANGFLPSQIRYAGSDPNASNPNAAALGYDPASQYATYNPATDAGAFNLGLSGTLGNGLQSITGANRQQTAEELQMALGLPVTHTQAAASGTTGVSAPAPAVAGRTVVAAVKTAAPAPAPKAAPAKATVASHPATNASASKAHVTTPSPAVQRSYPSQATRLPGGARGF